MPRSMKRQNWEGRVSGLLSEMKENDGAIIEVSQDVTSSGQFYDYLEEFCTNMQQAQDKEEILLRRPWSDEENALTFFRLKDFEDFLEGIGAENKTTLTREALWKRTPKRKTLESHGPKTKSIGCLETTLI